MVTASRQQAREVDRRAVEDYGMSSLVLMENAGRGCVDRLVQFGLTGPVAICCGKGNNAGDGFVMARHLDLRGYAVKVLLAFPPHELRGDAAVNFGIIAKAGIEVVELGGGQDTERLAQELVGSQWIVDALLGTGATGVPRPPLDWLIDQLNAFPAKKFSIDVPSGLDCDSGAPSSHTFRAHQTCTFVASKPGYATERAKPYLGQVHVLDIGVPRRLVEEVLGRAY